MTTTSTSVGLQDLTVQIACALGELFFAVHEEDSTPEVSLEQAHIIAAGRMDLWAEWPTQPERLQRLVGRFLRIRHNDLGAPKRFREAALRAASSPESPYRAVEAPSGEETLKVVPVHGQSPAELAESLLEEAEAQHAAARCPVPLAGPGMWGFGWAERSIAEIPASWGEPEATPFTLSTAPPLDALSVSTKELVDFLTRLLEESQAGDWQPEVLENLLGHLKDASGEKAAELVLTSGALRLLNAPTGVGKSVLTRALALYLAAQGITVAIAVGTINAALDTDKELRDEADEALRVADQFRHSSDDLDLGLRTGTLITPRRLAEKARQAAARDDWQRFDRLAYGCELAAHVIEGPAPQHGKEPCTGLRRAAPDDSTAESQANTRSTRQALCPRIHSCTRHRGLHEAAVADIIVVNHHNLMQGSVQVPVSLDGTPYGRLSVLEFVMRRCQVVLIDEIDLCQSNMFDTNAQQLVLADSGGPEVRPLTRLDSDRGSLPPSSDRDVMPALSRTRFLAEQFLNYALDEEVWLEKDPNRPSSGWHIPGSKDRLLLHHLFGLDTEETPGEDIYERFNALFPNADGQASTSPLPAPLAEVARLLRTAVSNDTGRDELRDIKHHLSDALTPRIPAQQDRRDVVNALLVRAWLGSLHQALTRLTYAVSSASAHLPAAGELATKLGTFVQHAAIPYGPLEQMLFGFKIDKSHGPLPQGRLSAQVIAGDPHTTIAQLGDTVALATAGTRRIVLGLSATAFFPGAAREHIHAETTYAMTDAAPGAFATLRGDAVSSDGEDLHPVRISGRDEAQKQIELDHLGQLLWDQHLDQHLVDLTRNDPQRERALVVGNSYHHAALLASGIARGVADPSWVAVVVPKETGRMTHPLPTGIVQITIEEIEDLPRAHPKVKVCTAPLGLVSRGLNILVPGEHRSALASIWVCARPVAQLNEPAEMFASVNAHALHSSDAGTDPAAALKHQHQAAHARLHRLLSSDPRFTRLPRYLKAEIFAGIMVDLIQLAGRARRGGTPVELYLVDHAFHDPKLGADVPAILRFYYDQLSPDDAQAMRRIYGSTLSSWLEFAGIPTTDSKESL